MHQLIVVTQVWIERSQMCPLSIRLNFEIDVALFREDARGMSLDMYMKLLHLVRSTTYRWRSASISLSVSENTSPDPLTLIQSIQARDVPLLEHLSMDLDIWPPGGPHAPKAFLPLPNGIQMGRQVRSMRVPHTQAAWRDFVPHLNWTVLTELMCDGFCVPIERSGGKFLCMGPRSMGRFLRLCPNLVRCHMYASGNREEVELYVDDVGDEDLGHLESSAAVLPKLQSLYLRGWLVCPELPRMLDLPALCDLRLMPDEWGEIDESSVLSWVQRFGKQLTTLSIAFDRNFDSGAIACVLYEVPNLEQLYIGVCGADQWEGRLTNLTQNTRFACVEEGWCVELRLCPKLRRLVLPQICCPIDGELLVNFINSRRSPASAEQSVANIEEVCISYFSQTRAEIVGALQKSGVDMRGLRLSIRNLQPGEDTQCPRSMGVAGREYCR